MPNALTDSVVVDETPEEPVQEAPETPETDAQEPEKPAAITPLGRRGKAREAQEALMAEIKGLRESFSKQGETYREQMDRIARENAELRGQFQGYMSRQQQAEVRREEKPLPDPVQLRRDARKALEGRDFDEYERLTSEAIKADVLRSIPQPQQQPQQSAQVNPMVQMVASQYMDVATDRAAFEITQAHDRILAAQGMPDGPDRWKRAFEEGRRYLGAKNGNGKPQQFSQQSRGVLSGVPTQRGEASQSNGAVRGVRLNKQERQYADRFKMNHDEYAAIVAEMHPERIETE